MILTLLILELTPTTSPRINLFFRLKHKFSEVFLEPTRLEYFWSIRKLFIVVTAGFLSTVAFFVFQEIRSIVPAGKVLFALQGFALTDHIQMRTITSGILANLQLFGSYIPSNLAQFAMLAVVGIIVLAVNSKFYLHRFYGLTFLVGLVSLAIFWVIFNFYAGRFNFASQTRYMIVFIPIISYCIPYLPRILSLILVMPILSLAVFAL
jgi:hypothetical protein